MDFKLVKNIFKNYLEAYESASELGLNSKGETRDIKQIEKAYDNRVRYLNNKIKGDELFKETNGAETYDSNLQAIIILENKIKELEEENEKCWKKIEKLKNKKS